MLWTEQKVQKVLHHEYSEKNKYFFRNAYFFSWESDVLYVNRGNNLVELEIKVSRSDWAKERKDKERKHKIFNDIFLNGCFSPKPVTPNKFFIVCPEGLIKKHEVEEAFDYAGLIWVTEGSVQVKLRKTLHKEQYPLDSVLLEKLYKQHNNWYEVLSDFKYNKGDIETVLQKLKI